VPAKVKEFGGHADVVLLTDRRHTRRWLEQAAAHQA
jgi:hypothetical protein